MQAKLYFCFPYRGVGGVSLVFLRVAEFLAQNGLAQCHLVDYADGFMARNRDQSLTRLIEYSEDLEVPIPAGAIAVFQSMTPWSIFPALRLAPGVRILFWNCHPFNLVPTLPGLRHLMQRRPGFGSIMLATLLRRFRTIMRRFVRLLLERQALVFMDRTNVTVTEHYLGISIQLPEMLAIPAPRAAEGLHPAPDTAGAGLRLAWVGRLVDFKYYPLKHALAQLDLLQPQLAVPMRFDVIGDGDREANLRADVCRLRNLRVRFCGEMALPALERHLRQETDMLFAMGASALEGARFGVPTLLLDLSYGEVPESYEFSWLHQRDGYSLADVAHSGAGEGGGGSLRARLLELINQPQALSEAARAYFRRNHEIDMISERLLALAQRSRCTYGDLAAAGVLGRGLAYRAFYSMRKGWTKR